MLPAQLKAQLSPPPCPSNFIDPSLPRHWQAYWQRSRDGSRLPWNQESAAVAEPIKNWTQDVPPWQSGVHGYFQSKEGLYYKHPNGITYKATGVDQFPAF